MLDQTTAGICCGRLSSSFERDIALPENAQKFALRMGSRMGSRIPAAHFFGSNSHPGGKKSILSTLQNYKWHFFPAWVFVPERAVRHHNPHSHILRQPFCKTTRLMSSFVPTTLSLWNTLDNEIVKCSNITSFKSLLCQYF